MIDTQELRVFTGGQNTSAADGILPKEKARLMRGVVTDRLGKLRVTPGNTLLFTPSGGGLVSLTRYVNASLKRLIWSNGTDVFSQVEGAALSPTDIGDTSGTTQFTQSNDILIWTKAGDRPQIWRGSGTAYSAGLDAPGSGPTAVDGGAGVLNSVNKPIDVYDWVYTFVDANGVESAPSIASSVLQLNNKQATLAALRGSAWSSRVTKVNWYRRGGLLTDYYYVAQSSVIADTGIYPNTGASLTDNTRDIDVSTTIVPRYNARPPSGTDIITVHNERAWYGFTSGASGLKVYFSALSNPEIAGNSQDALASDGGYLTLPGALDDTPLCFASTGSLLVIGRKRSIYALYGNDFNNFALSQRANIGIISGKALVRAVNAVYFMGSDRRVYALTDNSLEWVSEDIQSNLDALTQAQAESAVLAYCDNKLALSFNSTAPDSTYILWLPLGQRDTVSGWTEEPGMRSRWMVGLPAPSDIRNEFVFINAGGTSIYTAFTDTTSQKAFAFQTGEFDWNGGATRGGGKTQVAAETLYIEAGISASTAPTVTVKSGYLGTGTYTSRSYTLGLTSRKAFNSRLHQDIIGEYLGVSLQGSALPGSDFSVISLAARKVRSLV